ncbi:splicing protein, NSRP1-like protein [Schizosaccharomyces osmophilus]|uniref:Splicing protein, NSRP1-like protein n=1 Tax=Schizosaccharomyces osmophilus TaxID=2545709 RepID=A0AAF0AY94_9SCHI|nr:splicing protein, NSRP1-like protein [Schizosaccharomyces osmophilus]WBW74523.1 splicing protein, NSRP1-like protein [Schizosaccharomyces osmophilus]
MSHSGFHYGLNLMKKPNQGNKNARINFMEEEEDSSDEEAVQPSTFQAVQAVPVEKPERKETTESDASVYGYDEYYDSMKSAEREQQELRREEAQERRPKYMEKLIESAKTRKRDMLIARERALQKQRESEGNDGSEKFVTGSYKLHREEMEKEIEDKRREEEELQAKNSRGGGMKDFYASMLEQQEKEHEKAMQSTASQTSSQQQNISEEKSNKASLLETQKADKSLELNDNNEIIDQRHVLSAGLNIPKPPTTKSSLPASRVPTDGPRRNQGAFEYEPRKSRHNLKGSKDIYSLEQVGEQKRKYEEEQKLKKEKEEEKRREIALKSHTPKTTSQDQVLSARERYLKRKREAAKSEGDS